MELFQKTQEALGGLWLAFDTREKVVAYGAMLALLLLAGASAERKRKREARELRDDIVAAVREALHG